MSGDAHVLIEQLRVDQKRLEDRVMLLERASSGAVPVAAPAPASRQRVVPSVRALPARPAVPPVPPIQPARPGVPRVHHGAPAAAPAPANGHAAAPAPTHVGLSLDGVLGAVGRLLASPEAAARLDRLTDSLMGVVTRELGELAGELGLTEGEPAAAAAPCDVPPVPPIVPAAPPATPDAVELGFAPGAVVEYSQTEVTRQ